MAIDSSGNIYAANPESNAITEYAAGASGSPNPIATISGANTGLNNPVAVVIDSRNDIYALNSIGPTGSSITLYSAGSNGNVTPTATITGSNTGLVNPTALAVGKFGKIYVTNDGYQAGGADSVTVYSAGSSGNVTPFETISGSSTELDTPQGIAVDSHGDIYVTNAEEYTNGRFAGGLITGYPAKEKGQYCAGEAHRGLLQWIRLP